MSGLPQTVDDLIVYLDKTFPEPAIGPEDTMDKIKFAAGARSVVAHLKVKRANAYRDPAEPRRRGAGRPK